MKFSFFICSLILLGVYQTQASLDSYTVSRTTGIAYTDITTTGGTAVSSWRNGTSLDENMSQSISIGFTFYYDGSPQTQFRVSTNGFITFNNASIATGSFLPACGTGDAYSGDNTLFSVSGTKGTIAAIAPFYDDLIAKGFLLNTSIYYQISGVAPDRILTVQWRGLSEDVISSCTDPCSYGNYNFQVKLYETTGNIEFIYGTMIAGGDELSKSYSCGLNSSSAQLLAQQSANTATFSAAAANSLSTFPQETSKILFTRILPTPASGAPTCINYNFPANSATNQCVNSTISWSSCDGVPTAYDVYLGTASPPPLAAGDVVGNFYNTGALVINTLYYWRIVPKNSFGTAVVANTPIYSFTTGGGNVVSSIISSLGNTICAGAQTTLTVNGSLSEGSVYNWTTPITLPFVGTLSCTEGIPYPLIGNCAASQRTFFSNSAGTQKFDVFVRGCNGTTSCANLTLTIIANSTAPTTVTSSEGNSFCAGKSTVLTASGGTAASGAQYAWYSGSCGGTLIPTSTASTITVTPAGTTTYYVRRVSTCPAAGTTCASLTITIQNISVGNNTISGDQTVCSGQTSNTLLGSLPTGGNIFTYQWESSTTSSSAGFAPISGTNIQNYSPGAISVATWFRRNVIQVDGCTTVANSSNVVQIGIGAGQCDDSNPCTQDVCNGSACKNICTLQISNPNSTNVSIQGCNDGTVSANVGFATCTGQWNALLYSGNTIQKSWTSAQGAQVLWDNVPAGNYLLVASISPECIDSADISVGITLSCNISVNNLVAAATSVQGCSDGTISATINATVCNGQWFATLFDNANATIKTWNYQLGASINWNGIAAGAYRIFVTDNKACSINQNVTVTNGLACSIQIQNAQTSIVDCDNNSITASIAALTCNNTWSAYLYNSDYSELLKTWSNQQGSTITWTEVSLNSYHIFTTNFSGCSDTLDVALDCSDNDPCTNDNCTGGCSHSPKCNDSNSCTTDICQNGQCTYQPIICNDNNPCTIDNCSNGNCFFTPRNCNDNVACTTDNCTGGTCTHTNTCGLTISGFIRTETSTAINGVTVIISGTISDTVVTGSNGSYSFGVIQGGNYTIAPSKSNDIITNNGVTTADITIIRKHVLTNNFITSPYKIIAADANNSGTVSTADIAFVRRVVLSNTASFPITTSPLVYGRLWSFISSSQIFSGPPYNPFPFTKTRTYPNLLINQTNQNFIGVKVGDVNGSWNSTIP